MSDIGTGLSPQPFDLFAMDGDENPSLAVPPQPPLDPFHGQILLPEMIDARATQTAESSSLLTEPGQASAVTPGRSENPTRTAESPLRPASSSAVNLSGAGGGPVAPGVLSSPRSPATPAQGPAPPPRGHHE